MKYRICWHKKDNPEIKGEGGSIPNYRTAINWVDAMNKDYPNLLHFLKKENKNW